MQNGQNDNLDKESIFSFTPTGDGSNPENTITVNRDFGNVGNIAVSSLNSNQETLTQSSEVITNSPQLAEAPDAVNGELLAKPEYAPSNPEFNPAPNIDPNNGPKLEEVLEDNTSSKESDQNSAEELDPDDIKINETLSDTAVRKIDEKLIRKLESDRDTNYFYRNARKATIANVKKLSGGLDNLKEDAA